MAGNFLETGLRSVAWAGPSYSQMSMRGREFVGPRAYVVMGVKFPRKDNFARRSVTQIVIIERRRRKQAI